jgi:hypothetical protein
MDTSADKPRARSPDVPDRVVSKEDHREVRDGRARLSRRTEGLA